MRRFGTIFLGALLVTASASCLSGEHRTGGGPIAVDGGVVADGARVPDATTAWPVPPSAADTAGNIDAAAYDAASPDAPPPDAAAPDSAPSPDAPSPDAAPPDAVPPDAAPPDAAPPDAAPPDAASPSILELRVIPEDAVLAYGSQYDYRAIATFDNGTTADVTSLATWSVGTGLSVSPTGTVQCTTTGASTVKADYASVADTEPLRCHFWSTWNLGSGALSQVDFDGDTWGDIYALWNGYVGATEYGVFGNGLSNGQPGSAETIAVEMGPIESVSAGMNHRGDRHAAWVWGVGDDEQLEARHKLLGGAWQAPWVVQSLADTNVTAGRFRVCHAGRTYASLDGPRYFVPATGWQLKSAAASVTDTFCDGASVWTDRWSNPIQGDAVYVSWFDGEFGDWTGTDEVFLRETPVGESFTLSAPMIGMDAFGNAMVAWVEEYATFKRIMARRHTSGGGWSAAVEVAREAVFNFSRLAVGPSGHALLLWDSHPELRGAYFDPSLGWAPPMDVAAAAGSDHYYSWVPQDEVVGVDNDGRGYVIYQEWAGTLQRLRVGRYHPSYGWLTEVIDSHTSTDAATAFVHASIFAGLDGVAAIAYVRRVNWNETIVASRFAY